MSSYNLKELANLCKIAYEDVACALEQYEAMGYEASVLSQPLSLEQVYALKKNGNFIAVLTGSNQLGDWIKNLSAIPGWYVHPGYSEIATALRDSISTAFNESKMIKLYIVGHSKGGAVAAILGDDLEYLEPKVVTFGAPRIGSQSYADFYKHRNYTRVVHPLDLVARLPLHSMGYRHCGQPTVWNGTVYDNSLAAWTKAQKRHPTIKLLFNLVKSIQSHYSYWD